MFEIHWHLLHRQVVFFFFSVHTTRFIIRFEFWVTFTRREACCMQQYSVYCSLVLGIFCHLLVNNQLNSSLQHIIVTKYIFLLTYISHKNKLLNDLLTNAVTIVEEIMRYHTRHHCIAIPKRIWGSFNNYVDQFWSNFNHLRPSSGLLQIYYILK